MNLIRFTSLLKELPTLRFELPSGAFVSAHFHVTEVGQVTKHFIDCGGKIRTEQAVNFQLWEANDSDHRLHPEKLLQIIQLAQEKLGIANDEIEVEYQCETIGKYGIEFNGNHFVLVSKLTACLAKDKCGIPQEKVNTSLADLSHNNSTANSCTPGSGCC